MTRVLAYRSKGSAPEAVASATKAAQAAGYTVLGVEHVRLSRTGVGWVVYLRVQWHG